MNSWSCLPCAFARILNIPVEDFIQLIGHDGSAKPYKDLPGQKAGFHEQEAIEVCQHLGYACTPIEIVPQMMPVIGGPIRPVWFDSKKPRDDGNWKRFLHHLKETRGVITGVRKLMTTVIGHAVAWDGVIHDSQGRGFTYTLKDAHNYGFIPRTYWKIQETING